MSETIAITGKSVKLFKGHYTTVLRRAVLANARVFRKKPIVASSLLQRHLRP
ncbi:MAG: hypothetical protein ACREYE_07790 [Gammaproteobacteria bacterium]